MLGFSKDFLIKTVIGLWPNCDYREILTKIQYFHQNLKKYFFGVRKKIFFSELRKKFGYIFEVKNSNLSNYDVFSAFWALQKKLVGGGKNYTLFKEDSLDFGTIKKKNCYMNTPIHNIPLYRREPT